VILCKTYFMPHRSTAYVDAAYCYRPSSVVYRSVCHTSDPAKTDEAIEMPLELKARVDPRNHELDGDPDPLWEGAILRGKGRPIVKYRDTLALANRSRCRLARL